MSNRRQAGVTLVELIVAMVIMGVAVAGLVGAFRSTVTNSAEPVIVRQMAAIAEGMMEEVLLKPFAPAGNAGGRANFNDVNDFDGYQSSGITNVEGGQIEGLASYSVQVEVDAVALTNVPSSDALRVTVTVKHPGVPDFVLHGWRTRAGP